MKFLAILLVICALANISIAIKRKGICPSVKDKVISDFDFAKYMGKWYELKKYPFEREQSTRCVTADYTLQNATTFYFKHEYLDAKNVTQGAGSSETPNIGYLSYPDELPIKGILSMVYRSKGAPKPNYYILNTDYTNFAIVWGCRNLPASTTEFKSDELAWVLSRTPSPTDFVKGVIEDSIEKYLEVDSLKETVQNSGICGYQA